MRYTLKDISDIFAKKSKLPQKKAEAFTKTFFKTIIDGLEQDSLTKVKNFGTFKIVAVSDRQSVDVNTGKPVLISGHNKVTFTPDEKFKSIVNRPFSQYETIILNDETDTEEIERVATPELPEPVAKEDIVSATPLKQEAQASSEEVSQVSEKTTKPAVAAGIMQTKVEPTETAEETKTELPQELEQEKQKISKAKSSSPEHISNSVSAVADLNRRQANRETEVTEEIEISAPTNSEDGSSNKSKWRIAVIVLGLLLLAALIFLFVKPGSEAPSTAATTTAMTDSTEQTQNDSLAKSAAQAEEADGVTIGENGEKLQIFDTQDRKDIVKNFEAVGTLDEYELKSGDYVEHIATKRYGNPFFVKYIYDYNNLKQYSHVSTGTVLKLPKLRRKK